MDSTATVITAIGGAVGVVLASWAMVVKARSDAAEPKHLLRRLWDWLEATAHHEQVPHTLAEDIRTELQGRGPDETPRP